MFLNVLSQTKYHLEIFFLIDSLLGLLLLLLNCCYDSTLKTTTSDFLFLFYHSLAKPYWFVTRVCCRVYFHKNFSFLMNMLRGKNKQTSICGSGKTMKLDVVCTRSVQEYPLVHCGIGVETAARAGWLDVAIFFIDRFLKDNGQNERKKLYSMVW